MVAKRSKQSDISFMCLLQSNNEPDYSAEMGYLYNSYHRTKEAPLYLRASDGRWYPHSFQGKLLKNHPSYDDIQLDEQNGRYIVRQDGLYGVLTTSTAIMIPVCFVEIEAFEGDVYCCTRKLPDGSCQYIYYCGKQMLKYGATKTKHHCTGAGQWAGGWGSVHVIFEDNLYIAARTTMPYRSNPNIFLDVYNGEPRIAYWGVYSQKLIYLSDISYFVNGDIISVCQLSPFTLCLVVQRADKWMVLDNRCAPLLPSWADDLDLYGYAWCDQDATGYHGKTFENSEAFDHLLLVEEAGACRCVALPPSAIPPEAYKLFERLQDEVAGNRLVLIDAPLPHQPQLALDLLDVLFDGTILNHSDHISELLKNGCHGCPAVIVGELCEGQLSPDWVYAALRQLIGRGTPVFLIGRNGDLLDALLCHRDIPFAQIYFQ